MKRHQSCPNLSKKLKHQSYPFLDEDSSLCDYELKTDEIASFIGLYNSYTSLDVVWIIEIVYHCNGSLRGKIAVSDIDLMKLEDFSEKLPQLKEFVLPTGGIKASHCHIIRCKCKEIVRLLHKMENNGIEIPIIIFEIFNLLANLFFQIATYENATDKIAEVTFISKSY